MVIMSDETDAQTSTQPARRKPLGFEEMIAILVAFGAIGSILFWGLSRQTQEFALNLDGQSVIPASPLEGMSFPQGVAPVSPVGAASLPTAQPTAIVGNLGASLPTAVPTTAPSVRPDRADNGNFFGAVLPAAGVGAIVAGAAPSPAPIAPAPVVPAAPAAVESFPDVPPDYWARPFVEALAKRGIAVGSPDGSFRPDEPVTRAEFAALLQKSFDQQESQGTIAFTDVPADFWATPSIDAAVRQGFLKGYPSGDFQPNKQISRLEVLLSLVNGLGLPRPDKPEEVVTLFKDSAKIPQWAVPATGTAAESNIVVNYPSLDQLKPEQPTTRAEVAALIYQALVASGKVEQIPSQYIVKP
jgi:S-layer homology domain